MILDDIERILEYVSIGPRFSNPILQALLVLLKKQPPLGRRLMCIGTTSLADVMHSMELTTVFNVTLNVPNLTSEGVKTVLDKIRAVSTQELEAATNLLDNTGIGTGLPVKKLLLLVEMARQRSSSEDVVPFSYLVECMQDLAL